MRALFVQIKCHLGRAYEVANAIAEPIPPDRLSMNQSATTSAPSRSEGTSTV